MPPLSFAGVWPSISISKLNPVLISALLSFSHRHDPDLAHLLQLGSDGVQLGFRDLERLRSLSGHALLTPSLGVGLDEKLDELIAHDSVWQLWP